MSGLFRGATPTVVRAMALNMGMLAANEQAKDMLEEVGVSKCTCVGGEGPRSWILVGCMAEVHEG